jgi:hypothetical protein
MECLPTSGFVGKRIGQPVANGRGNNPTDIDNLVRAEIGKPGLWVDLPLLPDAKQAISMLRGQPVLVAFLSSIPREYAPLRAWWLERHFGKYLGDKDRDWVFESVKHSEKPQLAADYCLDFFIEDSPDTAVAMKELGIESYLVPIPKETPTIEQITLTDYVKKVRNAAYGR